MKIISDLSKEKFHNSIVTLGKFDGFHIGHQLLIDTAVAQKQRGMDTVVFTFDVNPLTVVEENEDSRQGMETDAMAETGKLWTIQDREERIRAAQAAGIDYLVLFPFNRTTMSMEPERFVKEILVDQLDVKVIVAGYDFRFGRNRAGNVDTLRELGEKYGFSVQILDKVKVQLEHYDAPVEVSSTLIKKEIQRGHMENVRKMLGQYFSVTGVVEHGKHLGTTLGFPTINFRVPAHKIMPPNGVYATKVVFHEPYKSELFGKTFYGITNVGKRPTFHDGEHHTVETNIFDFDQDVYGRTATVFFCKYMRAERKFDSVQELSDTIEVDKGNVREFFHILPESR